MRSSRIPILALTLFLLSCLHGLLVLPAWEWRGLDLQNLHAFHTNCGTWPIPYALSGAECGDALGRPLVYPPLMYWAMGWLRAFDFYRANLIWSVCILIFTLFGTAILASLEKPASKTQSRDWALWSLLLFQLPMVYALERGNYDAAILPIYCGAIFFFVRKALFPAGFLLATACWMKVYPVIPSVVLLMVLALDRDLRRKCLKPLFLGFAAGGAAWAIIFLPDSYRYLFEVLPRFAAERGGIQPYTHILYKSVWAWIFLKLPILFLWGRMTLRSLEKDPVLVLSGGLAISTFFQNTSNDYNFVTAYPFLFVILSRFLRAGMRGSDFTVLILTFLVYVGDRTLWMPLFGNRGVLYWQILWLFVFPLFIDRKLGGTALTKAPRVKET